MEIPIHRLPAGEIERLISHQMSQRTAETWEGPLPSRSLVLQCVEKITVYPDQIEIVFLDAEEPVLLEASLTRCGSETRIDGPSQEWTVAKRDPSLIKLIVRAHQAREAFDDPANTSIDEAASSMDLSKQYFCRLLRLGYLAPDITAAILDGNQPSHINRQFLGRVNNIPDDWAKQHERLGFERSKEGPGADRPLLVP